MIIRISKKYLYAFLLMLLFSGVQTSFAQNRPPDNIEKLAASYFSSGEYEKARDLYEDLLKRNRYSVAYYESYLQCLLKLEDYKEAVKFTKKQSKSFPANPSLAIDYAWILEQSGDKKGAKDEFKKILDDKQTYSRGLAPQIAIAFQKRGYTDYAITVYKDAQKLIGNEATYNMELAELYAIKGDYGAVFGEYLQYLEVNSFYYEHVKSRLQLYLTDDNHYEQLKDELIKRVQKNPDNKAYQELLLWTFVQMKDWDGAFLQTRAMDLRTGKTGSKIYELAKICIDNEAYSTAIKCFENLTARGEDFFLYNLAETGLLKVKLLKIKKGGGGTNEELNALASDFNKFLSERGNLPGSEDARLDLADLYIHYMNLVKKGIDELDIFINLSGISHAKKGRAKLILADAYLINGEEWDAHLLYKQVENDFKDDPLGQEARFKYALLSYYRGEFDWALTQLDVLKGATTQLISNNAIELSLKIIENTGLDTSEEALTMFARAELLFFMNKINEGNSVLDSLQDKFSYNELSDDILFLKAKVAEKTGDLDNAVGFYEELVKKYYFDILADDALISLARLYEYRLDNKPKAIETYEKILLEYSGSLYSFEARNRYRYLKGQSNMQ